jgi:hypothetical protein
VNALTVDALRDMRSLRARRNLFRAVRTEFTSERALGLRTAARRNDATNAKDLRSARTRNRRCGSFCAAADGPNFIVAAIDGVDHLDEPKTLADLGCSFHGRYNLHLT